MTEEQTVSIMAAILASRAPDGSIEFHVRCALALHQTVAMAYENARNLATDKQRAAGSDAT
jgi:hypothetical protein